MLYAAIVSWEIYLSYDTVNVDVENIGELGQLVNQTTLLDTMIQSSGGDSELGMGLTSMNFEHAV